MRFYFTDIEELTSVRYLLFQFNVQKYKLSQLVKWTCRKFGQCEENASPANIYLFKVTIETPEKVWNINKDTKLLLTYLRPATLLKRDSGTGAFAKFLRTSFLQNTSGRLLLFTAFWSTLILMEHCLFLDEKEPRRHWRRSGIFIVNFEHISHLFLVFLLLTLSR